jgi:hypothetical protein
MIVGQTVANLFSIRILYAMSMRRLIVKYEGTFLLLLITLLILVLFLTVLANQVGVVSDLVINISTPTIAAIIGALAPVTYKRLTRPKIVIGEPVVESPPENGHSMPKNTKHLRLPVSAKNRTIHDVRARIVGGSEDLRPRGKRELFWAREFRPHGDEIHKNLDESIDVLRHMGEYHLSAAGPIGSISPNQNTEYVNIVMKVEDLPATFLTNAEGDAGGKYPDWETFCSNYDPKVDNNNEFLEGKYIVEVEIDGESVSVPFKTGPEFGDLESI